MLDHYIRRRIDAPMQKVADLVGRSGLRPTTITVLGFVLGLSGCFAVALQAYIPGLLLLMVNRFLDGLDGGVARASSHSDLGQYLDQILDVIIYAAFMFFFVLGAPAYLMAATFLLFAYLAAVVSLTAFRPIAQRRTLDDGLILVGHTEMGIFILASCLYPPAFPFAAMILGIACLAAAVHRVLIAIRNFR